MQYEFVVDGTELKVTLDPKGAGWAARVTCKDGTQREWMVDAFRPGHLILDGTRSVSYGYSWHSSAREGQISLAGRPVGVASPQPRAQSGKAGAASGKVKAPMNGQVVKLLRQPGDTLIKGEVILVLEAMKMENEVTSPIDGCLESVAVSAGQSVAAGDLLCVVNLNKEA